MNMKRFICVSIVLFGLLSSVAALDVPVNLIDTMRSMIDRSVSDIPKSAQRIDDTTLFIPLINSPNEGVYWIFTVENNAISSVSYRFIGSYAQIIEMQNKLFALIQSLDDRILNNDQFAATVGSGRHSFWLNFAREMGENNLYGTELIILKTKS
jgi:hypothetical protein